jgi:hypothetical protein
LNLGRCFTFTVWILLSSTVHVLDVFLEEAEIQIRSIAVLPSICLSTLQISYFCPMQIFLPSRRAAYWHDSGGALSDGTFIFFFDSMKFQVRGDTGIKITIKARVGFFSHSFITQEYRTYDWSSMYTPLPITKMHLKILLVLLSGFCRIHLHVSWDLQVNVLKPAVSINPSTPLAWLDVMPIYTN